MNKIIQVWVGCFRDEVSISEFTEEQYGDDDLPISKFISSQGQDWIDHDFMETQRFDTKSKLRDSLFMYVNVESWESEFEHAFKNYNDDGNYVMILNQYDISPLYNKIQSPVTISNEHYYLKFLGETNSPF